MIGYRHAAMCLWFWLCSLRLSRFPPLAHVSFCSKSRACLVNIGLFDGQFCIWILPMQPKVCTHVVYRASCGTLQCEWVLKNSKKALRNGKKTLLKWCWKLQKRSSWSTFPFVTLGLSVNLLEYMSSAVVSPSWCFVH